MDCKKIMYLLAGLLVVVSCWYFLSGRNDVSDIGDRADAVRNGLESAEEEQRDQAESLDRAEGAADRSQSAVRDSEERADRVQELERSDAEIIRESQSIINRVRARGRPQDTGEG